MYTVVDADSRSVETVLEAVRAGRIQPYGRASPLREKIKTTVYAVIGKFHIIRKWISLGR
jgi:hypothetical protein